MITWSSFRNHFGSSFSFFFLTSFFPSFRFFLAALTNIMALLIDRAYAMAEEVDEVLAFMPTLDYMRSMKFVKAVRKKRRETRRFREYLLRIDANLFHEWDVEQARRRREREAMHVMERRMYADVWSEHAEAVPYWFSFPAVSMHRSSSEGARRMHIHRGIFLNFLMIYYTNTVFNLSNYKQYGCRRILKLSGWL